MMKLYKKSGLIFSLVWIALYCVAMSVADVFSEIIGINSVISLPVIFVISLILTVFIFKNKLNIKYGLCRPKTPSSKMLWYIPLLVLLTANFWQGATFKYSFIETVLYIFTMLGVGFFEEIVFRGLLFNAMLKDNRKTAIIISSVTFGLGHIINLFNGSGMTLVENILQIISAIAIGFLFVIIYEKSGSIIVCIASHGLFNSASAFSNEAAITTANRIMSSVLIVILCAVYSLYILHINKNDSKKAEDVNA